MKPFNEYLNEEIVNTTQSVGTLDTPPESFGKSSFAGMKTVEVDDNTFSKLLRRSKKNYESYSKFIKDPEKLQEIREYAMSNPRKPIVVSNSKQGSFLYLKR